MINHTLLDNFNPSPSSSYPCTWSSTHQYQYPCTSSILPYQPKKREQIVHLGKSASVGLPKRRTNKSKPHPIFVSSEMPAFMRVQKIYQSHPSRSERENKTDHLTICRKKCLERQSRRREVNVENKTQSVLVGGDVSPPCRLCPVLETPILSCRSLIRIPSIPEKENHP